MGIPGLSSAMTRCGVSLAFLVVGILVVTESLPRIPHNGRFYYWRKPTWYNGETEEETNNSYEPVEDTDYFPLINYYGSGIKRSIMEPDQPINIRPNRNAPRKHLRLNLFSTVL